MRVALCAIVVLSGAAALVFETLLYRLAALVLGNSVWAVSLVLTSFMVGLALGNAIMSARGDRLRDPLRAYALLELAIGASGLALVVLLPAVQRALVPVFQTVLDQPWILNPLRLGIAFVLMLAPAMAMGMTLPVLVGALARSSSDFGSALGALYGWNTLGAVAGALCAERVLVDALGVTGAGCAAAAMNASAAAATWWLVRSGPVVALSPPEAEAVVEAGPSLRTRRLLVAAALFGAMLLALEVVWFRLFLLFVPASDWNLAVLLATVLAGIGLGGVAASAWFRRRPDADRHLTALALLAGSLVAALYLGLEPIAALGPRPGLGVQVYLMLPVSFLSGLLFTCAGQAVKRSDPSSVRATGRVTFFNTVGAALGSMLAGFALIPALGIERSLFALACGYGVAALLCFSRDAVTSLRVTAVAAVAWVAALLAFPFGALESGILTLPGGAHFALERMDMQRVLYREGLTETLQYWVKPLAGRPLFHRLATNSHPMSDTSFGAQRYMKLYVYWPVALNPELKRALLISYGVGSTAKALTDTRSLESIDVVDISREILEAGHVVFPDPAEHPLNDPRVRVHIEDGRFFLLTTDREFDLITAEPPPPRMGGIGNLYSREYFELVRDRLADGGIVTYWLPVHQLREDEAKAIARGFCSALPRCSLWLGYDREWMLVGIKDGLRAPGEEAFSRQWSDPEVGSQLRSLGFASPEQFAALFIADGSRLEAWLGDTPPLTDGWPQRLRSRPTAITQATLDAYDAFALDGPAAAESFAASETFGRLWPPRLGERAGEHFALREEFAALLERPIDLERLHRALIEPRLAAHASWALGSHPLAHRLVADLDVSRATSPELRHLASLAVERRDFASAARLLEVLAGRDRAPRRRVPAWLEFRFYFHLRAGELEAAQELERVALRRTRGSPRGQELERFFTWARTAAAVPLAKPAP